MAAKSLRQVEAMPKKAMFAGKQRKHIKRLEKVVAGLPGPHGLCCRAAAIWYVQCDQCLEKCS